MIRRVTPEPKAAATVILLRPGADVFEVLMVKRHPNNLFVPDCYVFPGGAVETVDLDMQDLSTGMDGPTAHQFMKDLPSPEMALATWIAGIRETFEETGILLAYDRTGTMIPMETDEAKNNLAHYRALLRDGRISFKTFMAQEGLSFATDRLAFFSHWITPIGSPIRYDVRFFIAQAPPGQNALYDDRELTEHVWISPDAALALYDRGRFDMVLPTIMTLQELRPFKTVDKALAFAATKRVSPILTKLKFTDGHYQEVMPDDGCDEFIY